MTRYYKNLSIAKQFANKVDVTYKNARHNNKHSWYFVFDFSPNPYANGVPGIDTPFPTDLMKVADIPDEVLQRAGLERMVLGAVIGPTSGEKLRLEKMAQTIQAELGTDLAHNIFLLKDTVLLSKLTAEQQKIVEAIKVSGVNLEDLVGRVLTIAKEKEPVTKPVTEEPTREF
jgi:signal transduction histidine kinase